MAKLGNESSASIPSKPADENEGDTPPKNSTASNSKLNHLVTNQKRRLIKKEFKSSENPKGKRGANYYGCPRKELLSKIFSTIFVFTFLLLLAVIVGAYFAMPSKMGPILSRFGVNLEDLAGEVASDSSPPSPKVLMK